MRPCIYVSVEQSSSSLEHLLYNGSDEIVRLHQRDANPVNMDVQGECFVVLVAPAGAIVVLRTVDIMIVVRRYYSVGVVVVVVVVAVVVVVVWFTIITYHHFPSWRLHATTRGPWETPSSREALELSTKAKAQKPPKRSPPF